MIIAVLGAPGSFSEAAARQMAGVQATLLSVDSFEAVFDAVTTARADFGVVPVRNALAGAVGHNAERVRAGAYRVVGATRLTVRLSLIARPGATLAAVRCVASHPVALRQCRRFFAERPWCVPVPIGDTASGVRDLMAGRVDADAVIGSARAARRYGAMVLLAAVHDASPNYTDFVMIGRP